WSALCPVHHDALVSQGPSAKSRFQEKRTTSGTPAAVDSAVSVVVPRLPAMLMSVSSVARRSPFSARFIALTLSVALWAPPVALSQPSGIPSMGAASSAELSPALERTLGEAIMEQGRRDPTYIADPDVSQYLTELGRELARHASTASAQPI